jgi:hypothetical protein
MVMKNGDEQRWSLHARAARAVIAGTYHQYSSPAIVTSTHHHF